MIAERLRRGPVAAAIRRQRLIAVLRRVEPRAALLDLVDELAGCGVRLFEITLDGPSGADDLRAVREHLEARGVSNALVGAGTVLEDADLLAAAASWADFAVAPVLDLDLLEGALRRELPFVPGALTPTEIRVAWRAGATFVKLFPASAVGPALVRELRGPLPDVELIPTGGIDTSNASAFLAAGAAAVGVGGALARGTPDERRALIEAVAQQAG